MNADAVWHDYDYAVVRVVPRVHLDMFFNVGIVLHARTTGYLGIQLLHDLEGLAAQFPSKQAFEDLKRHLAAYERIVEGGLQAGPIGLLPASERFHWLTAPRSAVLQTSEIHGGRTQDPPKTLDHLFSDCISPLPG